MGTRKFEKIILSSAKSKDEIVAEALAQINKYEAKDPANDYICSVIHAYDSGDNAGDQYIIINEKLRVEYGLKGNAVASSHYSMSDIKAMIDAVDAKIPLDPAKEALLKEVESIEADIRAKEAQLPPKEKELRNLKQQKATIEQEIADLNALIAEARAEGRSTTVLEASKAQREADLAAKNKQISTLEGQINEIKRQIPLLKEQAKNKQTQQESIKSPELATKDFVNELKATLTGSIDTKDAANVKLTGNQTIAGVKTFTSDIVSPNITNLQTQINNLVGGGKNPIVLQNGAVNITAGVGGDFTNLTDALMYIKQVGSKKINAVNSITLLSDFNDDLLLNGFPVCSINCNGFKLAKRLSIVSTPLLIISKIKLEENLTVLWSALQINNWGTIGGGTSIGETWTKSSIVSNSSIIGIQGDITLTPPSDAYGICSKGASKVYMVYPSTYTQNVGAYFAYALSGGVICSDAGVDLSGVSVLKTNITTNTLTSQGMILGNIWS